MSGKSSTGAGRPPRVFLGTQEISGYYGNLEAGFRSNGVRARFVTTHPHPFGYEQAVPNPWPARWASAAVLTHRRTGGARRLLAAAGYVASSVLLLLWALPRFDVFIFAWGMSILPGNLDIRILRLFGKQVITVLGHGSEARPPYMSTPRHPLPLTASQVRELRDEVRTVAQKVRRIERWSTHTIGLVTTAQFFREPFVDFYRLGLPTPHTSPPEVRATETLTVVHLPSNPEVKGTAVIRACVEAAQARHPGLRYVEVSGRPHAEVLTAIEHADVVVDQLWSDIPMAVVGTEAASRATPTIISGYAWPVWQDAWAEAELPPTILATPETLCDVLERAVGDVDATREIGDRARRFVEERWDPAEVAARYLQLIRGENPAEWIVEPSTVTYGWGVGVARVTVEAMVAALVDEFGVESLEWAGAVDAYGLREG